MFYIAAGLLLMWIATILDYHALMAQIYPLYIASVVLLVAVLLIGKRAFGSTRWIPLPAGIHLQVSEFAKIVIVVLVARFLTELRSDVLELRDLLKLAGIILLPMALIAKEPDLGTALTYLPVLGIGVFLAGMRWKYWLAIAVVALIVVPIGYTSLPDTKRAASSAFSIPSAIPRALAISSFSRASPSAPAAPGARALPREARPSCAFFPCRIRISFSPLSPKSTASSASFWC